MQATSLRQTQRNYFSALDSEPTVENIEHIAFTRTLVIVNEKTRNNFIIATDAIDVIPDDR